ncbi:MAG TPA: hypothetical protein DEQ27_06370 [Prevotella sp.]|nr:hypothetical protein [Prevotella sp.]
MSHNTIHYNAKANAMRRNMTPAEVVVWQYLRRKALGVYFRRQCPVGEYILDFYSSDIKLCIELDGDVHSSSSAFEYDERRTDYLNSLGITVLRYDNSVVFNNIDAILDSISSLVKNPRFIKGDCRNAILT